MMRKPNKTRGEVALKVGGQDLILCATMANLDALEQETGGLGLTDLIAALSSYRFSVLKASLVALTVEGDAEAAWSQMVGAGQMPEIQSAIMAALVPDMGKGDPGNVGSAAANP